MSLVPLPEGDGAFLAIQEFFPVFKSEGAGIVHARPGNSLLDPWEVRRVIDLPFVHRIEVVGVGGVVHVAAATLCSGKESAEDWSKPGAVYVGPVPVDPAGEWAVTPILESVSKNHGMHVTTLAGRRVVMIAGSEGLFAVTVPRAPGARWQHERILDREISDVYVDDLDGDGEAEIGVIEPFHGDSLTICKRRNGGWQSLWQWPLEFGHVVWVGRILGKPGVLAGSRGGAKELVLLRPPCGENTSPERIVIDRGVGATQVAVMHEEGRELILSANHGAGEVALYELAS